MADPADFIVVVSGLPRSGTSLMMQMLAAGGLPVVSDGQRPPDQDNPRGYWEDLRVLDLPRDSSWLGECRGAGLKVIATLLPHLPSHLDYRVIFLRRRREEMVASQNRMLLNQGLPASELAGPELAQALGRHESQMLAWAQRQNHMRVLPLTFHQILQAPAAAAAQIDSFLPVGLDQKAMVGIVEPELYRQRGG